MLCIELQDIMTMNYLSVLLDTQCTHAETETIQRQTLELSEQVLGNTELLTLTI